MGDNSGPKRSANSGLQREEPAWADSFLTMLESGASVVEACKKIGIDDSTPYKHRTRTGYDTPFATRWAEAVAYEVDSTEDTLGYYMRHGYPEEVFVNGELKTRRVIDPRVMLAYLKARRPEKWSERRIDQGSGQDRSRIEIQFVNQPDVEPDTTKED